MSRNEEILRLPHRLGLPVSQAEAAAGSEEPLRLLAGRSLIPGGSSHDERFRISPRA